MFARARGFDGRIQREDIGLEGNPINHTDDLADPARGLGDLMHGLNHLVDAFAALYRRLRRANSDAMRFTGCL